MAYRLAADALLILHLAFIVFVLTGGLLCLRHLRWAWLHLPAAIWGIWIEWGGLICPLTPLENHFRKMGAGQGYPGGFIEHYLVPLVYPEQLTVPLQWVLGFTVLGVNLLTYGYVVIKHRRKAYGIDE